MKTWLVKFSSERRSDGIKVEQELEIKAMNQIQAEDIAMRKCRLIDYKNYQVEAKEITCVE